jgi:ParB family chromosome partitioning protein
MTQQQIEWIPIAQVHTEVPILPSRQELPVAVGNIREPWLKKPITVLRRDEPDDCGKQFDLVSGHCRIQAFVALGEATIPAVIIETSPEMLAQPAPSESSSEGTTHRTDSNRSDTHC